MILIRLRPLEREDLKQLQEWRNDPEIFARVREYRPLSMENQRDWFESLLKDWKTIMFGICPDTMPGLNDIIGVCGLTNIDWISRRAEVSIYIGSKRSRRKGHGLDALDKLASYAFGECNLERLWAEVFSSNLIGQRLFEKAGYEKEGSLRAHAFKDGSRLDSIIYGLLRKEWARKDAAPH